MSEILMSVSGVIYLFLGSAHGLYTWLDTRSPKRIVPDDPAVIEAMAGSKVRLARGGTTVWKAWVGFNYSHSISLLLMGALCLLAGLDAGVLIVSSGLILALTLIGLVYVVLAVRYWFSIPIFGASLGALCLAAALLLSFI
ncbi:MAG: hypothetical protein AAF560_12270 [Acidobacteriota bacterium]